MISVTRVKVTGFSRQYFDVDWEIAPTHDDLQEWKFFVERSEAEAGPFQVVAGPVVDRYYLRDNTTPQVSVNRTLFYRVRAVNDLRGVEVYSPVADREGQEDLIAEEIGSLETLYFEEFAGTVTWLLPRRTFGQRCPQCWDDVLARCLDDSCPTCFGTGFSGGYHYPVQLFAQFDRAARVDNASTEHLHQRRMVGFRCPASPRVSPGDLIIDHANKRYRVVTAAATSRLGVEIHQEVQLVELQPGAVEDTVDLKVDGRTLETAAHRNFTNPQCPESAGVAPDSSLDDFLGRYGYR